MSTVEKSWQPIVELLEQFEYWPVHAQKGRWRLFGSSLTLFFGGLGMLFWTTIRAPFHGGIFVPAMVFASAVLILLGVVLAAWSIPSPWFAGMAAVMDRCSGHVTLTLTIVSTMCLVIVSTIIFAGSVSHQLRAEDQLFLAAAFTVLTPATFVFGGNPIRVGLSSHRARLRNAVGARWSISISLICITAVLASFLPSSVELIAVTLPATLAILSYHYQRARIFDDEISSFMTTADNIRRAGLTAARSPESRTSMAELYRYIRELQLILVSRPRVSTPPLVAHGFTALCSVADSRATGRDQEQLELSGAERHEKALAVFGLSDSDFALGTAQIFDGILQQTADGLTPSITKTSPLLKDVLAEGALPRPSPTPNTRPCASRPQQVSGHADPVDTWRGRGARGGVLAQESASMSSTRGLTRVP